MLVADLHPISVYHLFAVATYITFAFSPVRRLLEFSSFEVKYDIFRYSGEGTWQRHSYNTHNITSLTLTPQACIRHLADGRSLHDGRVHIHTHTHTHTHTCTHTHTHTHTRYICKTINMSFQPYLTPIFSNSNTFVVILKKNSTYTFAGCIHILKS